MQRRGAARVERLHWPIEIGPNRRLPDDGLGNGLSRRVAMNVLQTLEQEQVKKLVEGRAVPDFRAGDTVRVGIKVVEGERERVQTFEGVCIGRKNSGINSNFTLRKISYGEGVERVFPLYSPRITAIEVGRRRWSGCSPGEQGQESEEVVISGCPIRHLPAPRAG